MVKSAIRTLQELLNANGFNAGTADGMMGPDTTAALDRVPDLPADWPTKRKAVGYLQLQAKARGIDVGKVDGLWGSQTQFAYDALKVALETGEQPAPWRPEEIPDINPNNWPRQTPEADLIRHYGPVGSNQTSIDVPYPHKLAWDTGTVVNRFSCHERVHDSLHRVLTRVVDHYGLAEIRRLRLDMWGGCLNVRQMRGGTRYSTHSWGIALDYDPSRNQLKWGRDKATLARSEYDMWWRLWEEEGWVSLGRQRNFDWMHVQAARI